MKQEKFGHYVILVFGLCVVFFGIAANSYYLYTISHPTPTPLSICQAQCHARYDGANAIPSGLEQSAGKLQTCLAECQVTAAESK